MFASCALHGEDMQDAQADEAALQVAVVVAETRIQLHEML